MYDCNVNFIAYDQGGSRQARVSRRWTFTRSNKVYFLDFISNQNIYNDNSPAYSHTTRFYAIKGAT